MIPVRARDTRMVGCTGDSQVVISNSDLEDLIVSVLDAVDSPVDVRALRSLVMSRLPVMDIYLVPLDGDDNDPIRFINGFVNAMQNAGVKIRLPSGQRDIRKIITGVQKDLIFHEEGPFLCDSI